MISKDNGILNEIFTIEAFSFESTEAIAFLVTFLSKPHY